MTKVAVENWAVAILVSRVGAPGIRSHCHSVMPHRALTWPNNSSARSWTNGQGSQSTRLANELVEQLRAAHPGARLTLRDLTEGYTAFANGGIKVEPVMIRSIEDKDGNAFFTDEARRREALSPETAALWTAIVARS